MHRYGSRLAMAALLAAITIGFNWKLVLSGQYTWLDSPDNAAQVLPWLQMQAVQWHGGHFPVWDPYLWAGQPIVGQVQPGALDPLNWILFSMPLKNGFIRIPLVHRYWVAIQFLGVLFGYMLCRDLKSSRTAAVLGGCAFGLSGFIGGIGWPQPMMGAVPLPLVLMFFLRMLRGQKPLASAAASGALLGASFLSGHHVVPTFASLLLAGLWVYYLIDGKPAMRSKLNAAAAFAACCGLIAAFQILPAYELAKLSVRWTGIARSWGQKIPYNIHDQYSLYPTGILGIVIPGFQHDTAVYIGLVVITLALIGVVARWQEQSVRVMSAATAGGLLFALGSRSLFHGILYALVPNVDKAREPSMAVAIFHVGLVVLAAYGLDSFRSQAAEAANRISIRLVAALALFLYLSLIVLLTLRPEQSEEYKVLALTAFVALLLAGILQAWSRSRLSNRTAGVLLILLLLFECNNVSNYGHQSFENAARFRLLDQDRDVAAFLKQLPGPVRFETDDKDVPYNFGDWFGLQQFSGFQPFLLNAISDSQGARRFRMLLATNYFLGRDSNEPDRKAVFQGQGGLKVFENPAAFPRARLVHGVTTLPNRDSMVAALLDSKTDLQRTVLLEKSGPSLDNCDGGAVEWRRDRPTSIALRVASPCRSMLVVADTWYPGWKAFVDDKPAEIWKAYDVVRGIVVDAGRHEVVMVYRPVSVYIGAILAGLGILLCAALQYLPGRSWKRVHSH